jgi:hypothetical protein
MLNRSSDEGRREDKSIQVTNNLKTVPRQVSKACNHIQMSNPKESRNPGNNPPKLFPLGKECKSTEGTSNVKMQTSQDF